MVPPSPRGQTPINTGCHSWGEECCGYWVKIKDTAAHSTGHRTALHKEEASDPKLSKVSRLRMFALTGKGCYLWFKFLSVFCEVKYACECQSYLTLLANCIYTLLYVLLFTWLCECFLAVTEIKMPSSIRYNTQEAIEACWVPWTISNVLSKWDYLILWDYTVSGMTNRGKGNF